MLDNNKTSVLGMTTTSHWTTTVYCNTKPALLGIQILPLSQTDFWNGSRTCRNKWTYWKKEICYWKRIRKEITHLHPVSKTQICSKNEKKRTQSVPVNDWKYYIWTKNFLQIYSIDFLKGEVYGENTYFHYQLLAISRSMVQITLKCFIWKISYTNQITILNKEYNPC